MSVNPKVLSFVRNNQPFLFLISGKNNLLHGKILIEIWHFLFCKVICAENVHGNRHSCGLITA
jgi:hypothetical protein